MTDADLNALDAFLAEKVMGWKREGAGWHTRPKHRPSLDFPGQIINDFESKGEHDFLVRPDGGRLAFCGCDSTVEFSPTSSAADAEEVREKWLRSGRCGLSGVHMFEGQCHATAHGEVLSRSAAADTFRLAELLAIARACGWEKR